MIAQVQQHFQRLFAATPLIVRSPGRINIIGEHIDYNNGFVLPAAISQAIICGISKRIDREIHIYSVTFDTYVVFSLDNLPIIQQRFTNYIVGVIALIRQKKNFEAGFNIVIDGNIPTGAGLSSSAALEAAVAFAINECFNLKLSRMNIIQIAQQAEHEYAGVQCGIMDQFASVMGKQDHLIQLDCDTLNYTYVPFNTLNYEFILLDTGVKHSLATSAYNERRSSCIRALALLKGAYPAVETYRDISIGMINSVLFSAYPILYSRAKYIIEEIGRVEKATEALRNNDFHQLGHLLFQTHDGLSNLYEVSCIELDFLVQIATQITDVLGARMMGGGFGGCTLNLVKKDSVKKFIEFMEVMYYQKFGLQLKYYPISIADGTSVIN